MRSKETHCDRVPETCFALQKTDSCTCTTKGVGDAVTSFVSYPKWNIKKIKSLCMPGMHMGEQRYSSINSYPANVENMVSS
jgi:hypothetical protein